MSQKTTVVWLVYSLGLNTVSLQRLRCCVQLLNLNVNLLTRGGSAVNQTLTSVLCSSHMLYGKHKASEERPHLTQGLMNQRIKMGSKVYSMNTWIWLIAARVHWLFCCPALAICICLSLRFNLLIMFQMYLLNRWILTDNLTAGVRSWTPNECFIPRKIHTLVHHRSSCTQKHIWHTVFTWTIWACASEDQANEEKIKKSHNFTETKIPIAFPFSLSWSLVLNTHRHMRSTTLPCKSRLQVYTLTWKQNNLEHLL